MDTLLPAVPEPPAQIYEDLNALEAYLQTVRQWCQMRQHLRADRARIEQSIALVEEEIRLCQRSGDEDIAATLRQIRAEFSKRLAAIELASACKPRAKWEEPETQVAAPSRTEALEALIESLPRIVVMEPALEESARPETAEAQAEATPGTEPELASEEPAPAALSPEELAARQARADELLRWVATIESALQTLQDSLFENGGRQLSAKEGFLLRGLACDLGSVQASAYEAGVAERTQLEVQRVLGSILIAADHAGVPLPDLPVDALDAGAVTASEWQRLAEYYRALAHAYEALQWHAAHGEGLSDKNRKELLNSVSACQQRVYRQLSKMDRLDPLQHKMFDTLVEVARNIGFLDTLNQTVTDKTLDRHAEALKERWERLQKERQDADEKRRKKEAKDAAIASVEEWVRQNSADSEPDVETLDDRVRHCLEVGVPPSSIPLRQALVHHHQLLAGKEQFAKVLEYVRQERVKQGLDTEPEDLEEAEGETEPDQANVSDEQREAERQSVAAALAGKDVLLLGGVPKQETCDDLQELLGCKARWLRTSKTDKASKFQADIRKTPYVVVLKNLVSHEICDKAREWTRESGGHCVVLPSGYGVTQIVHQLYEYLIARNIVPQ